ncbi:MAG: peptide-binding protein [Candidatus Rokubacteria bacterium]|nr:peptide-binding protein [Candidatus Rokubacteria bacterium]
MSPAGALRRAAAVLGLAALVAGCTGDVGGPAEVSAAGRATPPPAYGDAFVEPILGNISGLIPQLTTDVYSSQVTALLYNGLVGLDGHSQFVGELAESWTFSPDCRDVTFKLRRGVKWHDGQPFTSADVLFTHAAIVHPKTPTARRDDFAAVESIEAPDPYTVRIRYKTPYARALLSWATAILPAHLLKPYVEQGKLREAPQNWQKPVGTGPYRLEEVKSGEKIVLKANPDYFEGRPYITRMVYRIIPSQATVFLELKAGGLDSAGLMRGLTAIQYARQTDYPAFRKSFNKYRYASNQYTYFGFNLKDPRFADKRVRHAFAHAINRPDLIEGVLMGLGREATGPYKPGTWVYTDQVAKYPYDVAKAKKLLADAGWTDRNAEGLLVKNGKPFTFELLTNQGNEERKKVAEIIQASLRDIGIGVEIRVLEWASFLKEYVQKRRFEAVVLGWAIGEDPDQYSIWHSSKTGPEDLNHVSFVNSEVDELLERGRSACRREDRVKYYHRLQQILAEEQPYVFLFFRDTLPVVSRRVRGIEQTPNGIAYNLHKWYVPREEQRYTAD